MSDCSPDCNDLGTIQSMAACWPSARRVILNAFNGIYNMRCKGALCVRTVAAGTEPTEFIDAFNDLLPVDCDCPVIFIIEGCNIWMGPNTPGDGCDLSGATGPGDQWILLNTVSDTPVWPERATGWVAEMDYIPGDISTLDSVADTSQIYNTTTFASLPSAGDLFRSSFVLGAGSYTFDLLCRTQNNCGIISLYIDGVHQGEIDLYSAFLAANVIKSLPVTVVGDGRHTIWILIGDDINPSSLGYLSVMTKFWLKVAADSVDTV